RNRGPAAPRRPAPSGARTGRSAAPRRRGPAGAPRGRAPARRAPPPARPRPCPARAHRLRARPPAPPRRVAGPALRRGRSRAPRLLALDVPQQAATPLHLALGEHVPAVLVRVLAFLEHEAHRRADQLEALAEEVLEITAIAFRERAQAVAVDHEGRRVL